MPVFSWLLKLKPVAEALKDAKHSDQYRREHDGDLRLFQATREKLKKQFSIIKKGINEILVLFCNGVNIY